MNFTKEERMQIGREIYTHEITISEATEKYGVNWYTARSYMRQYRDINKLPPMSDGQEELKAINKNKKKKYEDLESMSKDQLINEVIKARVEAERAKKGYTVKGDGPTKEYIILNNENTK